MTLVASLDRAATAAEMRRVLGSFATGVTVVTGMGIDGPVGFSCQSFASVSLEPPLVLFCPSHTSRSWPLIRDSGKFCVNVLAEDQEDLCARFATTGADKFGGLTWHETEWGPSLDNVLSTVMCEVRDVHDAGDHDIVVGHVRELVLHREVPPLVFYRGTFGLEL
ncbi:MAG: 3-hydroxy-9,10-secoandrosta,3,5(10)-triene-9,17-dione monooxygenase reductase component [Actinomycetota bacterium]|jgi:flavin reductase (DIM6/NTAB) family NADH-FMN oxidoreductase RutF|nr:3-hydroxy-9,10-secoandrosta,3,5(10)-triene-9,17-dione monooxygenase reductase component [Actinomycetota bacterium]